MHKLTLIPLLLCCLAFFSLISAQQVCGPGIGACTEGRCCSRAGYCDRTPMHCGAGCQTAYGPCMGSNSTITVPTNTVASPGLSPSSTPGLPPPSTPSLPPPSTPDLPLPPALSATMLATMTLPITGTNSVSGVPSIRATSQVQPTNTPNAAVKTLVQGVKSTMALAVVVITMVL